jgi:hypothetical protein
MPRYHFDLIGKQTIVDHSGLDLADDVLASDAADRLANELYSYIPAGPSSDNNTARSW